MWCGTGVRLAAIEVAGLVKEAHTSNVDESGLIGNFASAVPWPSWS